MIDLSQMINGNMQQQSYLERQPTTEELDKFIDYVLTERDETAYSLFQAIQLKLEQQMHSPVEAEIYPQVLARIAERYGNK